MLMQLILLDVLSEATVPEVTLIAHVAANAGGAPPPIISAAKDDDANRRSDRRAMRRRAEPPKASVGMEAFEQFAEPALNGENDSIEVLAIIGIAGYRLRVQSCVASTTGPLRSTLATDRFSARTQHGGTWLIAGYARPRVDLRRTKSMNFRARNRMFSRNL